MIAVSSTSNPALLAACRSTLQERLAARSLKLPLLPKVAGQVLALTNDPNSDLSELSALIHRDQALAGHVLRIANSAAYAGSVPIVSLQQAVTRLGMGLLGEIALAVSVQGETFRVTSFQPQVKQLWRHALASGSYGKEVARSKRKNVEGQFLCGLLHTVGKPVALQAIADWQRQAGTALPLPDALALVEEFHCPIGEWIAGAWKLPQQVQVSCAFYSQYLTATTFVDETAMTYLSDRLASWLLGLDEVTEAGLLADPVLEALNLYPDEVEGLLGRKDDLLAVVNAMDL